MWGCGGGGAGVSRVKWHFSARWNRKCVILGSPMGGKVSGGQPKSLRQATLRLLSGYSPVNHRGFSRAPVIFSKRPDVCERRCKSLPLAAATSSGSALRKHSHVKPSARGVLFSGSYIPPDHLQERKRKYSMLQAAPGARKT